ncbi:MAG: hypothetical protein QW559_00170 [Candidatus Woesearchaeota archaeon]
MVRLYKILREGKAIFLAYDHGLEHGPSADFNLENCKPERIIEIAEKGGYSGVVLQPGIAEKYYGTIKKVPLIIKLNGRTSIAKTEPLSLQHCSVKRALKLGADAVGYTIYVGSHHEGQMFKEFGNIVEEAHNSGIPVIGWMYPRGSSVVNEFSTDVIAHAARAGLELGADIVKVKYNRDVLGFKWVVANAGKARVVVAGGEPMPDREFLQMTSEAMSAGAAGIAVGRNVWSHSNPLRITRAIKKIIFEGQDVDRALKQLG